MAGTEKDLLLVQIGPVQEFIAAARELEDLWSGSYLIAYLTAVGIRRVAERGGEIVFPCLDNQTIYWRLFDRSMDLGQPTLPNRFCAEVPHGQATSIAEEAKSAIMAEFRSISSCCFACFSKCFPKSALLFKSRWEDQVRRFLQISWQAVPLTDNWGASYGCLLENLAARRNTRDFKQYAHDNSRNGTVKDALNGQDETVIDLEEWRDRLGVTGSPFSAKQDKPYGAISIIKRLWREAYLKPESKDVFPTLKDLTEKSNGECRKYIAVIQMDGDHMGAILGNAKKDRDFFARFSRKLANFTRAEALKIIEKYKGKLIYAGGDDVLALLPACYAVDCARELHRKFCEQSEDMPGSERDLCSEAPRATLSAGIAVGHWKTPIARLLAEARSAEHRAKEIYGRDALAFSIMKRSGEIAQWGAKFDSPAWDAYGKFYELRHEDSPGAEDAVLSSRFASSLAKLTGEYTPLKPSSDDLDVLKKIIAADFHRVCERQRNDSQKSKTQKEENSKRIADFSQLAERYLDELFEPSDFPKLFLCASFLMRKRDENEAD